MKHLLYLSLLVFSLAGFAISEYPYYFIAIKKNEGEVLKDLDNYIALLPPSDRFYADPFLFKYFDVNYLFFEEYAHHKGVISYVTLDETGVPSTPSLALELPLHLSFPHIFCDRGEIFMTPETYEARSVSLYQAIVFPDRWVQRRILIEGQYFSDPILFRHNGYYWLFAAVKGDRLAIYYALDLDSEFIPHPINGLHLRGRNAGPVYCDEGRLIRPVMDCSRGYGRSMILKEIVTLDRTRFVERVLAFIKPQWAPLLEGTHTYCQNEDFVVYDGMKSVSKGRN